MKFIRIKQVFPTLDLPSFNFGAWKESPSVTCLLGRQLNTRSSSYYEPDVSSLLFVKIKNSKVIEKRVVWKPEDGELLEDPRALVLEKNKTLLGLTAVFKENRRWATYPAVAVFNASTLKFGDIHVIQTFGRGKNTTPLRKNIILFRPAKKAFNHKFLVFKFIKHKAIKICEVPVPKVSWGKWKAGTSSPPIWLSNKRALMFIAGINRVDGIYVYSIGKAFLEFVNNKYVIKDIDPEPLITRKTFEGYGVRELHPKDREVVYMCGTALQKQGILDLYVNVGDRNTFIVSARLQDFL